MRLGSLFAGIGGFDLAARWMGWETAWFSEIDPYASAVLKKHWPDVPNHGDITQIDFTTVESVDMLVGGFPCQDLSVAGKRKGLAGERSGLWSEYARAVRTVRPRWVVIENVPPLLTGGFAVVRGDLRAAGYKVARPVLMSASAVGAPHLRERLWVVAHADGGRRSGLKPGDSGRGGASPQARRSQTDRAARCSETLAHAESEHRGLQLQSGRPFQAGTESLGGGKDVADSGCLGGQHRRTDREVVGSAGEAAGEAPQWQRGGHTTRRGSPLADANGHPKDWPPVAWGERRQWAVEPDVGRVAHGVPSRVDRLKCLGNAIVPQCAFAIFREIANAEARMSEAIA